MALRVLLVDDSATMRKMMTCTLNQVGLDVGEVIEAGDGAEALTTLAQSTVDVVMCDWNMPRMNGLDFVVAARAQGHMLPIVMVTTESGEERIQQAKSAGANAFVTKPFTPERLAEALQSIFAFA